MTLRLPTPSLRHLGALTTDAGIVEHARLARPRPELGSCTDDAGRALVVACRLPRDPDARRIAATSVAFLERAHDVDGRTFALRAFPDGSWSSERSDDAAGRALLGLGVATASAPWPGLRRRARQLFTSTGGFRSAHPRATAYAVLGASAILDVEPDHRVARPLVVDAVRTLPRPTDDPRWPWPEPRLTYANALLPDALLAAGCHLGNEHVVHEALRLLAWLAAEETLDDHFSFTPVDGRDPGGHKPAFDQQPIEAATMAAACSRAHTITGDPHWRVLVDRAAAWFCGRNDRAAVLHDPVTGGCRDGLRPTGVNLNEGAESTIAFLHATTLARDLADATQEAS